MTTFSPSAQPRFMKTEERMFSGTAPSLSLIEQTYGEKTVKAWLCIQIRDFAAFCSQSERLSTEQIDCMAQVIQREYAYLKVTEIMAFFAKFKAGFFGGFYGSIDTVKITSALPRFMTYRHEVLRKAEYAAQQQQAEAERKERHIYCVNHDEYLAIKQQATTGDTLAKAALNGSREATKEWKERAKATYSEKR